MAQQPNAAAAVNNLMKTPELRSKILFTMLCLLVYRVGAHITVPGVDVNALLAFFQSQGKQGFLGLYDLFVGGGLSRATMFALGIMPYISSSIIFQLAGGIVPQVEKMQKDEEGRKKITQWTRYLTVAIAALQGYGFALFTESLQGAVANPGLGFRLEMTLILTAGAMFVMWLGEQITERGIGNGASLLIFFSIVERIWPSIGQTWTFVTTGAINVGALLVLAVMMVLVVAGTIAVTVAARRVQIQIPQRTMARGRQREAAKQFIPLRMNAANVMPIIFASTVLVVPATIAQFSGSPELQRIAEWFAPGSLVYYVFTALLIVIFTYFYTSIIFNPIDIAENLKKQGGFIPGIKPGAKTADYIDTIVTRITLPGAIFLVLIALLPVYVADLINVPFRFGGTSLLIVVGVGLDTVQQLQQHLLLRKYDGFMKKGRIRSGRRQTTGF
ncbi:MAG: preprotein translocase subunit SecY [Gemmatimonadaceae bacterium]